MTQDLTAEQMLRVVAFGMDKPPQLQSITAGELSANHIGSRVVTARDGATVDGRLTSINARDYGNLFLFSIEVECGSTKAEFKKLPLDYQLQIEVTS